MLPTTTQVNTTISYQNLPEVSGVNLLYHNLLDDIWVKIFTFLPHFRTQVTISLTCKRFHKLSAITLFQILLKKDERNVGPHHHAYLIPSFVPFIHKAAKTVCIWHRFDANGNPAGWRHGPVQLGQWLLELRKSTNVQTRALVAFCLPYVHSDLTYLQIETIQKELQCGKLNRVFDDFNTSVATLEIEVDPQKWQRVLQSMLAMEAHIHVIGRILVKERAPTLKTLKVQLESATQEELKPWPELALIKSFYIQHKMPRVLDEAKDTLLPAVSREFALSLVRSCGEHYKYLSEAHKADPVVALEAAKVHWKVMKFLPEQLHDNEEVVIELLKKRPQTLIKKVSNRLIQDKFFWIKAFKKHVLNGDCTHQISLCIPSSLENDIDIAQAICENIYALLKQGCKDCFKIKALGRYANLIVQSWPNHPSFRKFALLDPKIIFQKMPGMNDHEEFVFTVVSKNPEAWHWISDRLKKNERLLKNLMSFYDQQRKAPHKA